MQNNFSGLDKRKNKQTNYIAVNFCKKERKKEKSGQKGEGEFGKA